MLLFVELRIDLWRVTLASSDEGAVDKDWLLILLLIRPKFRTVVAAQMVVRWLHTAVNLVTT